MAESKAKTWMPVVAGILLLVVGGISLLQALARITFGGMMLRSFWTIIGIKIAALIKSFFALIVVVGGIFTLRRKVWWLALVGAIFATLNTMLLGIPALILVVLSKNEFS